MLSGLFSKAGGNRGPGDLIPALGWAQGATNAKYLGCQIAALAALLSVLSTLSALGEFKDSLAAWDHRVQVGISGAFMNSTLAPLGRKRTLQVLQDWSDRIAKGEIPMLDVRGAAVSGTTLPATAWRLFTERTVNGSANAAFPAPASPAQFVPWTGRYAYTATASP